MKDVMLEFSFKSIFIG